MQSGILLFPVMEVQNMSREGVSDNTLLLNIEHHQEEGLH